MFTTQLVFPTYDEVGSYVGDGTLTRHWNSRDQAAGYALAAKQINPEVQLYVGPYRSDPSSVYSDYYVGHADTPEVLEPDFRRYLLVRNFITVDPYDGQIYPASIDNGPVVVIYGPGTGIDQL